MSEQPTPETDAAWACFKGYMEPLQDVKDLSRKLERERDEAREAFVIATDQMVIAQGKVREANKERDEARERIERQKLEIVRLNGATNHAGGTPLKIALRKRDEAREALKHIEEYGTEEINTAVELRQKLATALLERDEAQAARDILRLDAQKEAEHHDRMVGELEKVYAERDAAREQVNHYRDKLDLIPIKWNI